jgi:hypothetical protein
MGVGGQRLAQAALPPGKTRYPLYRRLGGSQCQSYFSVSSTLVYNDTNYLVTFMVLEPISKVLSNAMCSKIYTSTHPVLVYSEHS